MGASSTSACPHRPAGSDGDGDTHGHGWPPSGHGAASSEGFWWWRVCGWLTGTCPALLLLIVLRDVGAGLRPTKVGGCPLGDGATWDQAAAALWVLWSSFRHCLGTAAPKGRVCCSSSDTGDGGSRNWGWGGRELGMGRSETGDGGQELGMGTVRWAALGARRVSALQEAETAPIKGTRVLFLTQLLCGCLSVVLSRSASAHRRGRWAGVRHGAQRCCVNVHRPCSWTPCAGSSLCCKIWDKQGS